MFNFRPLTELDAKMYQRLRLEALAGAPESFASSLEEEQDVVPLEVFQERLKTEGATTFGVFHFQELVGCVTLLFEQKQKLSHRSMLVAMYIQPKHQGNGLGRELLQHVIKYARSKSNIEQLYLTVVSTNKRAKKLYESLGFTCYGVDTRALKLSSGVYLDEDLMVLDLKKEKSKAPFT